MSLLRRIRKQPYLCDFCKYYYRRQTGSRSYYCTVFDYFGKTIPAEIMRGGFDHRYPHPEDGGIRFQMASPEQLAENYIFRNLTPDKIQEKFDETTLELEMTHQHGFPPTNKGHLPPEWFMNDT